MPVVPLNELKRLQKSVSKVRNICILAHVDHGKTTLADSLVASNGIISQRMAGKIRYLDNRPDEQERGITMKSSSISLYYKSLLNDEYLINLIDSPGHVDFSSEVSTAVRLCDGAILLVDVVEGVCPQTRACLKQIYSEHIKAVLVLNKIDRLILEKKMTPIDAYVYLVQLLEQINAVIGNIYASDILEKEDITKKSNHISALEDSDDSDLYFSPEFDNVLFCSAVDGWGFSINNFAKLYEKRIGINFNELKKYLWGDYYFNSKQKRCLIGAQEKAKKPMFVQFILENIWQLYEIIAVRKDKEKLLDVTEKLGIKLMSRDLKSTDSKILIKSVFSQWLPIENNVLEMIIKNISDPSNITNIRAERLLCPADCDFNSFPQKTKDLKEDFKLCNPESNNTIVFISKMIPVDKSNLPQNKPKRLTNEEIQERRKIARQRHDEKMKKDLNLEQNPDTQLIAGVETLNISDEEPITEESDDNEDQVFIAFARVFSGTLKRGMKLYILFPKHDPRNTELNVNNSPYITEIEIKDLYLLMGGELEVLEEVPAGNIVGIGNLQSHVVKTATLSNNIFCPSFTDLAVIATPILKVALEPVNPLEMPKLIKGLKLLNQGDACVEVALQVTGEHVISTLGEVHLEKCVKDLEETYAKIKLSVSEPIVPFRETIVPEATIDMVNEVIVKKEKNILEKIVTIQTANKGCQIKILALPLPIEIVDVLDKNAELFKILSSATKTNILSEKYQILLNTVKIILEKLFKNFDIPLFEYKNNIFEKIWSVGPKKCGTNILINLTDYIQPTFWEIYNENSIEKSNINDLRYDYNNSFVNGFQMATSVGPLCEEPMRGVCFLIIEWKIESDFDHQSKLYGPFSGQIVSAVKEGCRRSFQNQPQRLVSPMYSCNIIVDANMLGKMYAVIGRRHGKVLSTDLTQGSGNFSVTVILPVMESFNFAQEIRKQTSGLACPQLVFSHWEVIDIDPFWVPSTEEEYTHFGEKADSLNRAKVYMDSVRRRKGLLVEEKLVEYAEKQRTLSKKK